MLTSQAVYLTLLLCGCALVQSTTISVDLDTAPCENNNVILTVPPVARLAFNSNSNRSIQFNSGGNASCDEDRDTVSTCTLLLNKPFSLYTLNLDISETLPNNTVVTQNLNLMITVNHVYAFGCSKYVFPVRLNVTEMTGALTCAPVFVNSSINTNSVEWFRSLTPDGFNLTKIDDNRVNQASSGGVMNASLVFHSAGVEDAGYYFPMVGGVGLNETPPILVTYQPEIMSDVAEFSRILYVDPNFPQSTLFSCTVRSFPQASVVWRYSVSDGMKVNRSLTCSQDSGCFFSVSSANESNTYLYNITIVNLNIADSGIYSCFAENEAIRFDMGKSINAHSYHLRVKDHLLPLWPAIGTLAVPIVLVLLMLVGALWDKMIAVYCFNEDSPSPGERRRNISGSSSSAGSPVQLTDNHAALRRLSSANVQLLEEPGNI